jgi:hypothetical protein
MAASEPSAFATPRKRGTATTIKLRSGGSITLTLSIDLFNLTGEDRGFVLGLVDSLAAYAKTNAVPDAHKPAAVGPLNTVAGVQA